MADCTRGGDAWPQTNLGYQIVRPIGDGAGGRIYLARRSPSAPLVALKHIRRQTDRHIRFVDQARNEFDVSQRIHHSGIRRCLELHLKRALLWRTITQAVLVMEYFDGSPLNQIHFPHFRALVGCFIGIADALRAMHQSGYVHCDLKPQNILVNAHRDIRVIDLGQACPLGTIKPRIQGTPDYIAPEQVKCRPVTIKTDIFNFGATLYWCLARQPLPTLFTLERQAGAFLMDERFASPAEIDPSVPAPLSDLVMECVRTSPSKRPADMAETIRRLETIHYRLRRRAYPSPPAAPDANTSDQRRASPVKTR